MRYIGITGHRGSGKTSVAYLLGNTLEYIRKGKTKEQIQECFKHWCSLIRENNNAIYDCPLYYVYFDGFGEMPKSFVAQLLSIDMSVLDSDLMKDTMYVNMRSFKLYSKEDNFKIATIKDVLSREEGTSRKWKDEYMSLRDFMRCVSIDIMQRYFGSDVWLKSRMVNDEKYGLPDDGWCIFSDVKTKEEINYIKDKNGVLIRTLNSQKRKTDKGIRNIEPEDYKALDYTVITEGSLESLFDSIYEIAEKIFNLDKDN